MTAMLVRNTLCSYECCVRDVGGFHRNVKFGGSRTSRTVMARREIASEAGGDFNTKRGLVSLNAYRRPASLRPRALIIEYAILSLANQAEGQVAV